LSQLINCPVADTDKTELQASHLPPELDHPEKQNPEPDDMDHGEGANPFVAHINLRQM
jgi:hypothetical protein